MKLKKLEKLAKTDSGCFHYDSETAIFTASGSTVKTENCSAVWKTDSGFEGAYAGTSSKDNTFKLPKSKIRFGGNKEQLKIKVNGQLIKSPELYILIRTNCDSVNNFSGMHWIRLGSNENKSANLGGYISAEEEDFHTMKELVLRITQTADDQKHKITMTKAEDYDDKKVIVTFGEEV